VLSEKIVTGLAHSVVADTANLYTLNFMTDASIVPEPRRFVDVDPAPFSVTVGRDVLLDDFFPQEINVENKLITARDDALHGTYSFKFCFKCHWQTVSL
jgi:hypothetical protein